MIRRTALFLALATAFSAAAEAPKISFKKLKLSDEFWSEGADIADFNQDGHQDIVAGPFIHWGPAFNEKTAYSAPKPDRNKPVTDEEYVPNFETFSSGPRKAYDPLSYSDYFLTVHLRLQSRQPPGHSRLLMARRHHRVV